MRLLFRSPYKSVQPFVPVELPEVSIITGPNGSGKSHFLEAIKQGFIVANEPPIPQQEIKLYTWNDLQVKNSAFSPHEEENRIKDARRRLENWNNELRSHFYSKLSSAGVRLGGLDISRLLGDDEVYRSEALAGSNISSIEDLKRIFSDCQHSLIKSSNSINFPVSGEAKKVVDAYGLNSVCITPDQLAKFADRNWGRTDLLEASFAQLFSTYRDRLLYSKISHLDDVAEGTVRPFCHESFVEEFGRPPWEVLNEVLGSLGLDFTVTAPEINRFTTYKTTFVKSNGSEITDLNNLSSGEKILISIALSAFVGQDGRQQVNAPKILLFDEVDALLHPSMTRSLMSVMYDTIHKHFGIKIIMSTHSPSTVALAREEGLFRMGEGTVALEKISKTEAINSLTSGVPTLSIDYDGRRTVFTEGEQDARVLGAAYGVLRRQLKSELSLDFINVGTKSKSGDINGGCAQVRSIVGKLRDSGNKRIFGVVDWDGGSISDLDRGIYVLAEGERDGLENCLFDPLLVAAAVFNERGPDFNTLGLPEDLDAVQFSNLPAAQLQQLVRNVENAVLGHEEASDTVEVQYEGGASLTVRSNYLKLDDHELEESLRKTFPSLKRLHDQKKLTEHVTRTVMPSYPKFIPLVFREFFERLLQAK